jgi:hypothetical protein
MAGYVMILYAAGLFALVLWYLSKLTREVEVASLPLESATEGPAAK